MTKPIPTLFTDPEFQQGRPLLQPECDPLSFGRHMAPPRQAGHAGLGWVAVEKISL